MSTNTQPTVAVVGVPDVAEALRKLGFRVITAPDFRGAATAIAAQLRERPVKVVAETLSDIGFVPWVTSTQGKSEGVILLPTDPSVDLTNVRSGVDIVPLPATVNDLLPRLGFAAAMHPAGDVRVETREAPASLLVPLESAPAPVVVPAPVSPAAPAPAEPESAPAPAPEPVSVSQPDALSDVFDAVSAPVPTPQPAPAVSPAPHAATAPGTAFDELFDASSTNPVAPEPLVPAPPVEAVAPVPQPAQAPVPQPAPAPVPAPEVNEPAIYTPPSWAEPVEQARVQQPVISPTPVVSPAVVPGYENVQPAPFVPDSGVPTPTDPAAAYPQDDMFNRGSAFHQPSYGHGELAEVCISFAPKGGVRKTTQALMVAQTAAQAGLRVILIDGNRGQGGGVRTSLRLPPTAPTILNALSGDPSTALIRPDVINEMRPKALTPIEFAVVLAPPRDKSGPDLASGAVYARVFDWARTQADLVVVDTQEVEGHKTDIFNDFIIPAMRSGAWAVGIVDYDFTTADNMMWAYREFAEAGVSNARQLLVASNWPDFSTADREQLVARYGQNAAFVGVVGTDQNVADQKSLGNILVDSPAFHEVTRAVLSRVTGNPAFNPEQPKKKGKGGGLFGLFGGRR